MRRPPRPGVFFADYEGYRRISKSLQFVNLAPAALRGRPLPHPPRRTAPSRHDPRKSA